MNTVRISDMAENGVIADETYEKCVVEGPAVLQIGNPQVTFELCEYDDSKDIVFVPVEQPIYGAIDLMNVTFRSCTFRGIGVVGPQAAIERLFT